MTATVSEKTTKVAGTGEFTVAFAEMVNALKTLALPASGRKALPVFNHVLVEVGPDEVVLSAFDYEVAVVVTLPATGTETGRMLIEHATFARVLAAAVKGIRKGSLDGALVTVRAIDGLPVVHVAGYVVPLDGELSVDAFPQLPQWMAPTHVVARDGFVSSVARVSVAADTGETLPILTGMKVTLGREQTHLLATDRYRLALDAVPTLGTCEAAAIVPTTALTKLLARMSGTELRLGLDDAAGGPWFTIASENTTVRIRTILGTFPDVSTIVNASTSATITIERTDLLPATTRAVAISTATKAAHSPLTLTAGGGGVTIAPASQVDPSKVSAPTLPATCADLDGDFVICVNPKFLMDAIAAVEGEKVMLHLRSETQPLALTGSDSGTYRHIVMPVRRS